MALWFHIVRRNPCPCLHYWGSFNPYIFVLVVTILSVLRHSYKAMSLLIFTWQGLIIARPWGWLIYQKASVILALNHKTNHETTLGKQNVIATSSHKDKLEFRFFTALGLVPQKMVKVNQWESQILSKVFSCLSNSSLQNNVVPLVSWVWFNAATYDITLMAVFSIVQRAWGAWHWKRWPCGCRGFREWSLGSFRYW